MKKLSDIFNFFPLEHHAYGISSYHLSTEEVAHFFKEKNLAYCYERSFDTFKIDDARSLKQLQSEKTQEGAVFILKITVINTQAQNALLKVLEEPRPNTYFIIIYPQVKQLLPTLQSRLFSISFNENNAPYVGTFPVQKFIQTPLSERFEIIKSYLNSFKDDPVSKEDISKVLNELEKWYGEKEHSPQRTSMITTIATARSYLHRNGASPKMILDMVAVSLAS